MAELGIFLADGFEEIEALTVVDLCRRSGLEISMVSVTGQKIVTGSHGIAVTADCFFSDTDFTTYDMLILPGGMPGTKNLEAHPELMKLVDSFFAQGKCVCAICAAPSILGHRGILQNKKACCYPGFETQLSGAEISMDAVSEAGNVITSRGMGTAIDFGLAIVAHFCGKEKAQELATSICYKEASRE